MTGALLSHHENRIALDISDPESDVELKNTSTAAVPRQEAVVFTDFETVQGRPAIMNIVRNDNKNIPFAADIYDEQNNIIDNVGQGGQAFVRDIKQEGNIRTTWVREGRSVSCFVHYQQNTTSEEIAQSIILNGLRYQIQ